MRVVYLKDKTGNKVVTVPYYRVGDNYSAGDIGGESEHKLTIDEMPKHKHNVSGNWTKDKGSGGWGAQINNYTGYIFETTSINTYMSYSGSSKAHNNMPPYIVVYGWVKVSN